MRAADELRRRCAPSGDGLPRTLRHGTRRLALLLEPALRRSGLTARSWRAWEAVLARAGGRDDGARGDDGLPLPPPALRVRAIAQTDVEAFLDSGRSDAATLAGACAVQGAPIEAAGRLLDFGCGCGRVTRHWHAHAALEIHGTDHDADCVAWLSSNLPFVAAARNGLAPPLAHPDDHFGVVYAVSVFTHMTDALARAWVRELARVLEPGGLLLLTLLDERFADRLRPRERAALAGGAAVVQFEEAVGTNMCVAYHPRAYVESITRDFELLSVGPIGLQTLYVLRLGHAPQTTPAVAAGDG